MYFYLLQGDTRWKHELFALKKGPQCSKPTSCYRDAYSDVSPNLISQPPYDFKRQIQFLKHFWGGISKSNTWIYRAVLLLGGGWIHKQNICPSSQAATQTKLIAHKHSTSHCDHNTRNPDTRAWDVQHTCQTAIWTGVAGAPFFLNSGP